MTNLVRKFAAAAALGGSLLAMSTAASAATLVFAGGTGGLTAGQTDYANFDTTFGTVAVSGSAGIYTGNIGGIAADPAFGGQLDAYFAVLGGGKATFSFATAVSSFGFDLGSADNYNTVTVNFAGGGSQSFAGAQLNFPGPASGNQSIVGTNGRVTIFGGANGPISSVAFASSGNSFEFDNIGVMGAVPEPTTWALFILGFGMIGAVMRRKSASPRFAFA